MLERGTFFLSVGGGSVNILGERGGAFLPPPFFFNKYSLEKELSESVSKALGSYQTFFHYFSNFLYG